MPNLFPVINVEHREYKNTYAACTGAYPEVGSWYSLALDGTFKVSGPELCFLISRYFSVFLWFFDHFGCYEYCILNVFEND